MSRRFTKIICAILSAVVASGILLAAGCSKGHTDTPLSGSGIFTTDDAISNGGFAVEKGNYIYFINGVQSNSADNDYGKPVKGAISRISKTDYAAHNYSNTQIVVPQIVYSANHNAGIFIYGDEVYYGTPSTAKNADGVVQYQNLEMQSTKLDRSRTSAPYISFSDSSYEYRYVEVEGTVYLLYVATGETLYGESTGVTNIHSLNTKTGKNTLLVYNVASYLFDDEDKTNERIYYTMNVKNYSSGSNYGYNQLYTVTADKTDANEYDTSSIIGWDEDNDRYINCGQLVFEGRGGKVDKTTPFNYEYPDENAKNARNYTYTLKTYVNKTLVFTRSSTDISEQYLYTYKDGLIDSSDPIALNTQLENKELLKNGTSADSYKYIFDDKGDVKAVINTESSGGISINYVKDDGKLHEKKFEGTNLEDSKYFNIVKDGAATILFLDRENKLLYYSIGGSGANGHSIWRVDYSSENYGDYAVFEFDPTPYTPVRILDLDAASDWYLPEIIENQIMYATAASDMTLYTYIMVCDLRNDKGEPMSNAEIRTLNEQYESITKKIDEYGDSKKYPTEKYQNITNILKYAFYSEDASYVYKHQKKVNAANPDNQNIPFSDETLAEYDAFLKPAEDNNWKEFSEKNKTVNGKTVYANYRSYYYSLLGNMSSSDKEAYANSLVTSYLPSYTEETQTWWESIGTAGRVFFVIGMCLIGLLVIGGIIVLVVFLLKRKNKGNTPTKRRRIRVDTTDDKSIDVYNN